MTDASGQLFIFEQSAAARSAALLHKLDAGRNRDTSTRVSCTEPGCRAELLCQPQHADNLQASWRCLIHRNTPSTTPTKGE